MRWLVLDLIGDTDSRGTPHGSRDGFAITPFGASACGRLCPQYCARSDGWSARSQHNEQPTGRGVDVSTHLTRLLVQGKHDLLQLQCLILSLALPRRVPVPLVRRYPFRTGQPDMRWAQR